MAGPATAFVAGELRAQKARLCWTLDEIAARALVGRSTVDRALKGEAGLTVEALVQIAAAMGMDASALMREAVAIAKEGR